MSFFDFFFDFLDFCSFLVFFSSDSEDDSFLFSLSSFFRFFSALFRCFSVNSTLLPGSMSQPLSESLWTEISWDTFAWSSSDDSPPLFSPQLSLLFLDSSFRDRFFFLLTLLLVAPTAGMAVYGAAPIVAVDTTSVFPKIHARSSALFAPNFAALIFLACPAKTLFCGRLSAFLVRWAFFLTSFFSFLDFFFDFFSFSFPWCAFKLARTAAKVPVDSEGPPSVCRLAPIPNPSWRLTARSAVVLTLRFPIPLPSVQPIFSSILLPMLDLRHSELRVSSTWTIVMFLLSVERNLHSFDAPPMGFLFRREFWELSVGRDRKTLD
mmetsp:Transcript_13086/g.36816  ORF Transcript_13086/g.36816 Transcript_13086/m.36816 type:complete len:322 (+) Transcript_13086:315-1280(+)